MKNESDLRGKFVKSQSSDIFPFPSHCAFGLQRGGSIFLSGDHHEEPVDTCGELAADCGDAAIVRW